MIFRQLLNLWPIRKNCFSIIFQTKTSHSTATRSAQHPLPSLPVYFGIAEWLCSLLRSSVEVSRPPAWHSVQRASIALSFSSHPLFGVAACEQKDRSQWERKKLFNAWLVHYSVAFCRHIFTPIAALGKKWPFVSSALLDESCPSSFGRLLLVRTARVLHYASTLSQAVECEAVNSYVLVRLK